MAGQFGRVSGVKGEKNHGGRSEFESDRVRYGNGQESEVMNEDSWMEEGMGVVPATESLSDSQEMVPADSQAGLPWGDVQESMLTAFILDEQEWAGKEMKALAKRLRVEQEEFDDILHQTGMDVWESKRLEKLLEIERMKMQGWNWDRLEFAALSKLSTLVDMGQIKKPEMLMAIAATANRATRRGLIQDPPKSGGTGVVIQNNVFNAGAQGGVSMTAELPGAGSLGTIKLNLHARTIKQLSEERVVEDVEYQRLEDRAEMLGPDDITELSKLAEES
jgi:hypothetical protein